MDDAYISDEAEILSRTDGRTDGQGDSRSWKCHVCTMYVSDPREGCTVVEETKVVAQFAVGVQP